MSDIVERLKEMESDLRRDMARTDMRTKDVLLLSDLKDVATECRTEIESLRQRVAELEKDAEGYDEEAQKWYEKLAAYEKERDELRELAKWREKYSLTGSPEIYDNPSQEFHKWVCETHDAKKVGAGETATCNWYEGDDGGPWATTCNELFNIESEGPEANGMKFCCFCGKKLVEVRAEREEENE